MSEYISSCYALVELSEWWHDANSAPVRTVSLIPSPQHALPLIQMRRDGLDHRVSDDPVAVADGPLVRGAIPRDRPVAPAAPGVRL